MLIHRLHKLNLIPNRLVFAPSQSFTLYDPVPKDNWANIPDKLYKEETKAFKDRVSEKNKDIMHAYRLAMFKT